MRLVLKPKFIIIIGLNIILLMLALWLKPRFQTNDDIGMIYGYSGTSIFSEPTAVNAFSTKIWGTLMVFLYKVMPGIEVYTVSFFILIFLSNMIIHHKLFENLRINGFLFWGIFIPLVTFINLFFYLELQFTMVTGLLCFTAVLLLIRKPSKMEILLGCLLIMTATLIRPSLIPILLAFLFILMIAATYLMPAEIDSRKTLVKKFGLFTVIFCAVFFLDKGLHTTEEKRFLEFNFYRAGIVDFHVEDIKSNSLQPEWGKEEMFLFKNWFYNDTILYSQYRNYSSLGNGQNKDIVGKINTKDLRLKSIYNQLTNPYFRCIMLLSFIPLFFISQWKRSALYLLSFLAIYVIFYNLLTLLLKEPPLRLSFVLVISGIILHLFLAVQSTEKLSVNYIRFLSAGLLIFYGLLITKISLVSRRQDIQQTRCIETYDPSLMYIRWAGYPFELVDPFKVSTSGKGHKIVSMGAFSIHPAVKNEFKGFKYKNLTADIIGKDRIISFMMPSDTTEWKDFKLNYIAFVGKHYHRNVYFEIDKSSNHCHGYKDFKLKEYVNTKLD